MPASTYKGMGALPHDGITTFRVWAPFASVVSVVGNFNGWKETLNPLTSEGNGIWSADVPEAQVGNHYKFVLVNPNIADPLWKNDPYAREIVNENGTVNSVIAAPDTDYVWGSDDYQMPKWNELVIYELHIGAFYSDDPTKHGNFQSVISKLDYLSDLGINAIEIMAADEFETPTSLGYNPAYIFAIESDYGGPNGFRALVDEAHKRGVAIIYDVVYNHLGPQGLDLWRFDGWYEDDGGGIYFYNSLPRSHTEFGSRPDYGRGEVRQYLRDNALRWLQSRRVDGLRWDSTVNIRNAYGNSDPSGDIPEGWTLMQWIHDEIRNSQPWKISIAEDLQNNEWLSKDTGAGGAGFNAQWDAAYVYPLRSVLTTQNDENRDMYQVRDALAHAYNGNTFERVIYTASHDEDAHGRLPALISDHPTDWYAQKRTTLGAILTFTAPGIPMIFQGQEFFETDTFADNTLLNWTQYNQGIFNLYQSVIRLRRNWFNTTAGLLGENINVHHVNNADKLVAYHRWANGGAGDDVIVVANFANRNYDSYTIGFPRGGLWKVRFNSDSSEYSPDFGNRGGYNTNADEGDYDGLPYSGNIGIGPYSVIILSQDT